MLTSRAWWFVLFVLALLTIGVLGRHVTFALLALTLLFWFLAEWLLFAVRSGFVVRRLTVERELCDERGRVDTLWAGQAFSVHVRLVLRSRLGLSYLLAADRVPFALHHLEGDTTIEGPVTQDRPLELTYRVSCPAVGRVRFEGVRVQVADLQGFFYHVAFVHAVVVLRGLPVLVDERGHAPTAKRHNLLPPPGVHRVRRPGSGSELLDLRDYLPGDPPKTIAWKVSARRDRLITKEFETEVPLRCTLFVDTSNSVRVGPPGGNALARVVEIAAMVAQANAAARDMTGLCLFDEERVTLALRPERSPRRLAEVIRALTDAACLAPTHAETAPAELLSLASAFAHEVYPELMRSDLNRFPAWLPWIAPKPASTVRRPTWNDRLFGWQPWVTVALLFGAAACSGLFTLLLFPVLGEAALVAGAVTLLIALPIVIRLFGKQRRQEAMRKQLAALLSVQYDIAPGGLEVLLEDDDVFSNYVQRFLADHQVPYQLPLYDHRGRYVFRSPSKAEALARALLGSIGKGHDNELFVLLTDVLELDAELDPLLRAVRVALARHHQVVVICPWPPGLGSHPGSHGLKPASAAPSQTEGSDDTTRSADELLDEATNARFHSSFQRLRQRFARLSVPVVSAASNEPVSLILDRMARLRFAGRRR